MTFNHQSFELLLSFLDAVLERAPVALERVIDEFHRSTGASSPAAHYGSSSWRGLSRSDPQALHRLACGLKNQAEDLKRCYAADLREQFETFILAKSPAALADPKLLHRGGTKRVLRAYQVALLQDIERDSNHLLMELPLLLCMLGVTESIKPEDSPVKPDIFVHALRAALSQVTSREPAVAFAFEVLRPFYVAALRQEYRGYLKTLSSLGAVPSSPVATERETGPISLAYATVS